jgi:hypothetical protein
MDQETLQKFEDVYLETLNARLKKGPPLTAMGDWDWPAYGVHNVSAVVVGHRHRAEGDVVEVAYLVTIRSKHPIPNAGESMREVGKDGNAYTFVQLAASVGSDEYETQLLSTYVGKNPYRPSVPPPPPAPPGGGAMAMRVSPSDTDPTLPHPPP